MKTPEEIRMMQLYGVGLADLPEPYLKHVLGLPYGQTIPRLKKMKLAYRMRKSKPLLWQGVQADAEEFMEENKKSPPEST